MKDKIFGEILKMYPSRHDLNHKWELADKIFDIPVDGVQVKIECPCEELSAREHCQCTLKRSLTIGEALEMLPKMVEALKAAEPCLKDWIETTSFGEVCRRDKNALALSTKSLTTKDGGIVEVNDDSKD